MRIDLGSGVGTKLGNTQLMDEVSLATLEPVDLTPDPDEARAADAEFDQLISVVRDPLVRLAVLIHRIRERGLFRPLGHDSFEAYIGSKQLQFSRSFIFQLAKVGKMFEAAGIDPVTLPDGSEITKLAQISRLEDPEEQRRIVESGVFQFGERERTLRDTPVRELSGLVDRRLGREPRQPKIKALSETYDADVPWEGPTRFVDDDRSVAQSGMREMRIPSATTDWRRLVDDLGVAIRPLAGSDRDEAINALSRLYQELVAF